MQTQPIRLNPDDELAQRLRQDDTRPVVVESNGVRYAVVRAADTDIWADYDPERALQAMEKSAGILNRAGVDAEQLERDVYAERTQNSIGRPA